MDTKKVMRVGMASKKSGVKRTTILAAMERGEIPRYELLCGLPVVRLDDVRRWVRPPRGRPRLGS